MWFMVTMQNTIYKKKNHQFFPENVITVYNNTTEYISKRSFVVARRVVMASVRPNERKPDSAVRNNREH